MRFFVGLQKNAIFVKKLLIPKSNLRILETKKFFAELNLTNFKSKKVVSGWLFTCAGMVYGAVAIGGLTRLTESGLSMVNWDLFKTMKPPTNQKQWEEEFERYKQFPEYQFKSKENSITLKEFKFIWYMEYFHRMWGRAIGLTFFLPFAYFWTKKYFSKSMKIRMTLAGSLIICQGLLGWYMVKSGLNLSNNSNTDIPRVSQYRLASHLSLAFILYSIFLNAGFSNTLSVFDHSKIKNIKKLRGMVHSNKGLIFLTIVMGAFVAGLDAGLVYNSWPKFAENWIPENLLSKNPKWKNFFENEVTVQFIHRNLAYITLFSITMTWLVGRRLNLNNRAKIALNSLMLMGYTQVLLGVLTLIHYVPVSLAALHQNSSLALLSFALWLSHEIRRIPK